MSLSMSPDLFEQTPPYQPLAARMRPLRLEDYAGQAHVLGPGKPLREAIMGGQLHSMLLWGPPGVGKTSLAKLIAELCDAHFITLSAVLAGVKDIRAAMEQALQLQQRGKQTVLFIDEVHRFNKAQQDAFLPFVEDGTVVFIGATTENPSFELNNALLSRTRVYKLRSLDEDSIKVILQTALKSFDNVVINEQHISLIAVASDGDARRALNLLELAVELAENANGSRLITDATISEILDGYTRRFDKGGDSFYEQISALHKSVRGSDPDASLYWFCRMIDGGCDPLYIARRLVRMASEDIGNADPRALQIALQAWEVQDRLGSPEGELAIAQAVLYIACAAKSNAAYLAYKQAMAEVQSQASLDVPIHLRNAPTGLMKDMGYGGEYRYAHDEPEAYAAGENYFPEAIKDSRYYHPVNRGLETRISEKLEYLRQLDAASKVRRYE